MPATMYFSPIQFINQLVKSTKDTDPTVIFQAVLQYCNALGVKEVPASDQNDWIQFQKSCADFQRKKPVIKESMIK